MKLLSLLRFEKSKIPSFRAQFFKFNFAEIFQWLQREIQQTFSEKDSSIWELLDPKEKYQLFKWKILEWRGLHSRHGGIYPQVSDFPHFCWISWNYISQLGNHNSLSNFFFSIQLIFFADCFIKNFFFLSWNEILTRKFFFSFFLEWQKIQKNFHSPKF